MLSGLALIAYSNSFRAELAFDNQPAIQNDPRIRALTRQNLDLIWSRSYWFDNASPGLYRPLTTLSYLVNYVVFGNGERPAGYHWINFMIHTINAGARGIMGGASSAHGVSD
jgi:protein O-mannosyl-transferase